MMKKTNANLTLCSMIFVVSLVISNVVTAKTIDLGFTFFGAPATIPGAAVCYAITFLMTDVIGELWGKKASDQTVLFGAVGQIFATWGRTTSSSSEVWWPTLYHNSGMYGSSIKSVGGIYLELTEASKIGGSGITFRQ